MNNKGKSRKRAAPGKAKPAKTPSDEKPTEEEIQESVDIENQNPNTEEQEKEVEKPSRKRVKRAKEEDNDVVVVEEPAKKPVKRVRANQKSEEQEAGKSTEESPNEESSKPANKRAKRGKKTEEPEEQKAPETEEAPAENAETTLKTKAKAKKVKKNQKVDTVSLDDDAEDQKTPETEEPPAEHAEVTLQTKAKAKKVKKSQKVEPTADTISLDDDTEEQKAPETEEPPAQHAEVTLKTKAKAKKVKKSQKVEPKADTISLDDFEIVKPKKGKKAAAPKAGSSKIAENKGPKPADRSILQLKVVLRDVNPPIWRRIQVLNNDTFHNLHNYLKEAMGWMGCSSHHFIVYNPKTDSNIMIVNGALEGVTYDFSKNRNSFLKEQNTKLSKFLSAKNDHLLYEFDLGESWVHEITVEKILPPPGPKAGYPKCTGGKRACPPEECGGVDGYQHLMEVYNDPNHVEYEELITDWLGEFNPEWEPEKFNHKQIFKRVRMWVGPDFHL